MWWFVGISGFKGDRLDFLEYFWKLQLLFILIEDIVWRISQKYIYMIKKQSPWRVFECTMNFEDRRKDKK